jgi:hypothetical protein
MLGAAGRTPGPAGTHTTRAWGAAASSGSSTRCRRACTVAWGMSTHTWSAWARAARQCWRCGPSGSAGPCRGHCRCCTCQPRRWPSLSTCAVRAAGVMSAVTHSRRPAAWAAPLHTSTHRARHQRIRIGIGTASERGRTAAPATARPRCGWQCARQTPAPARGGWRRAARRRGARRRPWASTATSSACSAIDSSCSTLTTVQPRATRSRTSCSQSAWCGGSRLARGSSISSTCACTASGAPATRAGARRPRAGPAAMCASPRPGWLRRAFRLRRGLRRWAGQPGLVRQAAQHGHVVHGQVIGRDFVLPQPGQLPGASRRGPARAGRGPAVAPCPVCGISPASTRSRVDLPAPLGPTMLVQRPAGRRQVTSCNISCFPAPALICWALIAIISVAIT